jgi:diguanylate cyclase (GGDEF)-like protein/PAS domain S-box-containing protein
VSLDVNPAFCAMTGFARDELIGVGPPHPYWPPEHRDEIASALRRHVERDTVSVELTFLRKNGERFPVRLTPSIVTDDSGEPVCVLAIVRDESEQQRVREALRESEARYRDVVENVPIGMLKTTPEGRLTYVNQAGVAIFGYDSPQEMIDAVNSGSVAQTLYADPERRGDYIGELSAEPGRWRRFDGRFRRRDGALFEGILYFSESALAATGERYLYGFVQDVSGLRRTEAELVARNAELQALAIRLEELATTDALTATYNRRKFNELVETEIGRARRYGGPLSLFILDIDHFKDVNDTFGHEAGDAVLVKLAELVRGTSRAVDIVSRWGGEEFVVLTPGTDAVTAGAAAERLRLALARQSFPSCDTVTASFGVADYRPGDSPDQLFARADVALYKAKLGGRNRVVVAD